MNKIIIKKNPQYPSAELSFINKSYPAVIGREGVTSAKNKKEGDWKTPAGIYSILAVYYRPDRIRKLDTSLPLYEISEDLIWVDDSSSKLYNQPCLIKDVDSSISHEKLFRDDHLYDVFLDLDYNRAPAIAGKGSAIFMHVARDEDTPGNTPTAGCIALSKKNLLEIISFAQHNTLVQIES